MSGDKLGSDATIDLGRIHATPGQHAALGPTRLHMGDGHINRLESISNPDSEARHLVALPAPANAHDHGRGLRTLAFGAADQALETWLAELVQEPRVDPYLRAAVGFARMAEGGICASNHCHNTQDGKHLLEEARGVARAARDVGLRVAFAVPFAGRNSIVYGDLAPLLAHLPEQDHARLISMRAPSRTLEENMRLVDEIAELECENFKVQYGPVGPQWVDDNAMARIAEASALTGRRVHMHLLETRLQREWADQHYKQGLIHHLDQIGLLSSRLTLAHAVWLTHAECELLAERGVSLSANLSSNIRLRSGMPQWHNFLSSGLKFGLGLDGMSCDDDEDMLREMRMAWRQIKLEPGNGAFGLDNFFTAACVHGRLGITGEDGGGMIAEGAPADILVLDSRRILADVLPHARTDDLPLILARASKRDISRLIVGGRSIVEDGRCTSVDLPQLEAHLLCAAEEAFRNNPPDLAAMDRLRNALTAHYGLQASAERLCRHHH